MLSAISGEPDHVPLYLKWWRRPFLWPGFVWRTQFDRVEALLRLGIDDSVTVAVPQMRLNPEVATRVWKEQVPGEQYPLLHKEWITPKGTLTQIVRQTWDWPHGDDIPVGGDFVVSRSVKFLIETLEDAKAFESLHIDPNEQSVEAFHEEAQRVRRFAEEEGILFEYDRQTALGSRLPALMGVENMIVAQWKRPQLINRMLEISLEKDLIVAKLALDTGADLFLHNGFYENGEFWPPSAYRTFIAPRLKRIIHMVHSRGAKFGTICSVGAMPLLEVFADLGIDVVYGIDPVQGGADLAKAKEIAGDKLSLWGGLNSAVTLRGDLPEERIVNAVYEASRTLGPGGRFVLSAIDQIFEDTPLRSIVAMIDAWRKICAQR